MSAQLQATPDVPDMQTPDRSRIAEDLDARGNAVVPGLLSARQCDGLADLYPRDALFVPLQLAVLLSQPGRDFEGGEFVLTDRPGPFVPATAKTRRRRAA